MIIDDDADIRDSIEMALTASGYDVIGAADGAAALAILESAENLPSVILLDLRMPVMNGEQFRAAQLARPHLAKVPVVVLSGDANVAARAKALSVENFVLKPIDLDQLLAEVGRYAHRS